MAAVQQELAHDEIAVRAYEIFESAGGSELENWFRAEQELMSEVVPVAPKKRAASPRATVSKLGRSKKAKPAEDSP